MNTNLLIGIRTVIRFDAQVERKQAFDTIAEKNAAIMAILKAFNFLKRRRLYSLCALAVCLFGYTSFSKCFSNYAGKIVITTATYNEKKLIKNTLSFFAEDTLRENNRSIVNLLHPKSVSAFLATLPRCIRIFRRHVAHVDFLPACRGAQTLYHYICFKSQFIGALKPKGVIVTSNYSPDAVGLTQAAATIGVPRIFLSHTMLGEKQLKPNIRFDLAILTGPSEFESYKGTVIENGKVFYRGLNGQYRPMQIDHISDNGTRIGVFLTGLLDKSGLDLLLGEIETRLKPASIIVRQHPVTLVQFNLEYLQKKHKNLTVTAGTPLNDDMNNCDIIFVGNSTVTLEILKYGIPCVYAPKTDTVGHDFKNFVEKGILFYKPDSLDFTTAELAEFYGDTWRNSFSFYDPLFNQQEEEKSDNLQKAIMQVFSKETA